MSPLRVEARQAFGFRVLSVHPEDLQENPVKIINRSGRKRPVKTIYALNPQPELVDKFWTAGKGDTVFIPDVSDIIIDTKEGFAILKESPSEPSTPGDDTVFIRVEKGGYGLTEDETGEEKPKLQDQRKIKARQLKKKPIIVYAGGERAKVSWSEE